MARTIQQIYDALITEKETRASLAALVPNPDTSQTFLADLTTTSKVAIWRLLFFVVAVGIFAHEALFDKHKTEVEALGAKLVPGTALWLQDKAFKFQLGDTLSEISDASGSFFFVFGYAVIDESKQIIKRASVLESGRQVTIKVAKEVATVPTKLTAGELSAFSGYMDALRFAGTAITYKSNDPDLLKMTADVVFDPLVLSPTGELLSTPGTFPVEDAIDAYIESLPFDGVFNTIELTDAIQAATGVKDGQQKDPIITLIEAKFGANPFAAINDNYIADAGYMKIDPAFPLSGQITYIAAT